MPLLPGSSLDFTDDEDNESGYPTDQGNPQAGASLLVLFGG